MSHGNTTRLGRRTGSIGPGQGPDVVVVAAVVVVVGAVVVVVVDAVVVVVGAVVVVVGAVVVVVVGAVVVVDGSVVLVVVGGAVDDVVGGGWVVPGDDVDVVVGALVVTGLVVVVVVGGNVTRGENAGVVVGANGPASVVVVDGARPKPAKSSRGVVSTGATGASPPSSPSGYIGAASTLAAEERPMNQLTPIVTANANPPARATMISPDINRPTKTLLRNEKPTPVCASPDSASRSAICLAKSSELRRSRRFGSGNGRPFPTQNAPSD